jgi:hypothetical protein
MDASLIQKLIDLIATLKTEGKTDLVTLGTQALQCIQGGKVADGMQSLLSASKIDERFKQFLGGADVADTLSKVSGLAKAAGGLFGKLA